VNGGRQVLHVTKSGIVLRRKGIEATEQKEGGGWG